MKLSEHFDSKEFSCKCGCGFDQISPRLIKLLENLREHYNSPVRITSGCRCEDYNKLIGGVKNSQHVLGKAADIQIKGVNPLDVYDFLDKWHEGGLGRYQEFTHVDVRPYAARWG